MEEYLPGFCSGSKKPKPATPSTDTSTTFHAPWKLMRVVAGHSGWVRSIAVDPFNQWFATGSSDSTIKIWDLATGSLKLTLTGHIGTVRSLAVSDRHPYLYSVGDDQMIKCWDLEQNKTVRHYHGHLAGIYSVSLHPLLDVFATGSRDQNTRLWDMRTKQSIWTLTGHSSTVTCVAMQDAEPQLVTASEDSTIRYWDLVAGRTTSTLTHHRKGIRAVQIHPAEYTMVSAGSDALKKFAFPNGEFVHNLEQPIESSPVLWNALALNHQDGILAGGSDDGMLGLWDWSSGKQFQQIRAPVQPGSLAGEAGIFCAAFDRSGLRLLTGEADKSIKFWKQHQ